MAQQISNRTSIREDAGFNPWPHSVGQRSGIAMSDVLGCRCGWDPTLLWLWRGPAAAAAIQPLAWELSYAEEFALKKKEPKNKNKKFIDLFCLYYKLKKTKNKKQPFTL